MKQYIILQPTCGPSAYSYDVHDGFYWLYGGNMSKSTADPLGSS